MISSWEGESEIHNPKRGLTQTWQKKGEQNHAVPGQKLSFDFSAPLPPFFSKFIFKFRTMLVGFSELFIKLGLGQSCFVNAVVLIELFGEAAFGQGTVFLIEAFS